MRTLRDVITNDSEKLCMELVWVTNTNDVHALRQWLSGMDYSSTEQTANRAAVVPCSRAYRARACKFPNLPCRNRKDIYLFFNRTFLRGRRKAKGPSP